MEEEEFTFSDISKETIERMEKAWIELVIKWMKRDGYE